MAPENPVSVVDLSIESTTLHESDAEAVRVSLSKKYSTSSTIAVSCRSKMVSHCPWETSDDGRAGLFVGGATWRTWAVTKSGSTPSSSS